MIEEKDIKKVGAFQRTHGLKGELNVILDIDPEFFEDGSNAMIVEIEGVFVPFYAESIRTKGATSFLVKLEGIHTQEEAQELVNHPVYADSTALADFLGDDTLMQLSDVIGFKVVDSEFGEIGEVEEVDDSTENVLLIVKRPDGSEVMVPLVDDFIVEIDEETRTVDVELPESLIDLNVKKEDKDE